MSSLLWYRADLTAAEQVSIIRDRFAEALGAAAWPEGACLFLVTRHVRRGRVRHDTEAATVYFSPAAIAAVPDLIVICGAEPGPPPDRARATLLVGKASDWDLLPRPAH